MPDFGVVTIPAAATAATAAAAAASATAAGAGVAGAAAAGTAAAGAAAAGTAAAGTAAAGAGAGLAGAGAAGAGAGAAGAGLGAGAAGAGTAGAAGAGAGSGLLASGGAVASDVPIVLGSSSLPSVATAPPTLASTAAPEIGLGSIGTTGGASAAAPPSVSGPPTLAGSLVGPETMAPSLETSPSWWETAKGAIGNTNLFPKDMSVVQKAALGSQVGSAAGLLMGLGTKPPPPSANAPPSARGRAAEPTAKGAIEQLAAVMAERRKRAQGLKYA